MRVSEWIEASPPPNCEVLLSLAANLATAMVLVDYAAHGLATPTPWAQAAARALPADALGRLRRLRAVLAHGTVLREFVLDRLPAGHAAHREWDALRAWVQGLDASDVEVLVADGIIAGLAYYREEMDPMPAVEAVLARLGDGDPDREQLRDRAARRIALEAVLVSWGDRHASEAIAAAMDTERFRADLTAFLSALWEHAFGFSWREGLPRLEHSVAGGRAVCGGGPRAADEVVLEVTGLQPPPGLDAPLRRARHLQFVPCLHLGSYMSITRAGLGWAPPGRVADRFRVFYEPLPATSGRSEARRDTRGTSAGRIAAPPSKGVVAAQGTDPSAGMQVLDLGNLVPALEALGDATRVAMLQLLRRGGEMFAGQVAEALRLHPSTVSRHFAQLEAAGLVRVRREGNVKYYRLERERLRAVARVLEQELG